VNPEVLPLLSHRADLGPNPNGTANRLNGADRAAHDWYRFVLAFPPQLVRQYLKRFQVVTGQTVLDPFCGTGTTLVECKKLGISSIGVEWNPMAHFASRVKTAWDVDGDAFRSNALEISRAASKAFKRVGLSDAVCADNQLAGRAEFRALTADAAKVVLRDSISPIPLHKVLTLLSSIDSVGNFRFAQHFRLAVANEAVHSYSNLRFGPEIGLGPRRDDAAVIATWLNRIRRMAEDIQALRPRAGVRSHVLRSDSRDMPEQIQDESIDAVITSPPYPNEKDYTRTTRLESVLLGFLSRREDLKELKQSLIRSNTRNVYTGDDDETWAQRFPAVQEVAAHIERRRLELGKTSGFERLYARVTRNYFGGMVRHLEQLRRVLRRGARLAYVVGDQASYFRVMIRTGSILAEIAETLGYEVEGIDLFRTRLATATREQLREEVVCLRWP
jgi:DNA modification methylase